MIQFGLNFGIARFGHPYRCGQVNRIGDFLETRGCGAKRHANGQVGPNGGAAFAVKAVNHTWAFANGDFCNRAERNSCPGGGGDFQRGDAAKIGAGRIIQPHTDRDLPVVDGKFGKGCVIVANRCNPHHGRNLLRGDAKACSLLRAWGDLNFGPGQRAGCGHTCKQGITAQGGL